ncbi:hypothetical protein [Pseudoalteromonas aurantia]|uniref:Uncharacterized protein n=1 Tax=Pseudoalteromonas aurantia 208 TaxID=1314867 RepID=A0ABR9EKR1_9GAMM|nr:hypothetical protein [Pseudoalteromonas aurantia]MBE0370308.1 hypothetical protein [Pseudoalteromonas aurantia 208]
MYAQIEKPKGHKGRAVASTVTQKKSNVKQGFGFVDNRPETIIQRAPMNVEVTWGVTHLVKKTDGSLLGRGNYTDNEIGKKGELISGEKLLIDDDKIFRSRRGANQENTVNRERNNNSVPTTIWYHVLNSRNEDVAAQKLYIRSGTFTKSDKSDNFGAKHPLNETQVKDTRATSKYGQAAEEALGSYDLDVEIEELLSQVRAAPTKVFFDNRPEFNNWTPEDLQTLPIENIIDKETQMLDTHVPLYHGQNLSHWANTYFINAFMQKAYTDPELTDKIWLRNPFDSQKLRFQSVADRAKYLSDSGEQLDVSSGKTDNDPNKARVLLSTNPSLMQNSDEDAMESTADFVYSNMSVLKPSETNALTSLFEKINQKELGEKYTLEIDSLVQEHLSMENTRGVLFQILIPHHEVRDLVYISGKNGVRDQSNLDSLKTLIGMQLGTKDNPVNKNTLQARILMDPLMDPRRKTGVKIIPYFDKKPEVQRAIRVVMKSIDQMVSALLRSFE